MEPSQVTPSSENDARGKTDLIYNLSKKIGSTPDLSQLLEQLIEMTQKALKASAASILLFNDNEQELFFEAASGPVGKTLKSVKVDTKYSIAGQVARTGKPIIVNDVKRNRNFHGDIDEATGFNTSSMICAPLAIHQKIIGVIEVLNKLDGTNFDESDIHVVLPVGVTAAMAIENVRLNQKILNSYKDTLITLAETIDAKDPYTRGHSQRVMELSLIAGSSLALDHEQREILEYASLLHDIGKIVVDNQILNKPERLTSAEWDIIREHPAAGAKMLKKIAFLEKAVSGVLHHHEHYDGSGYPDGLKGEDIPLEARLITVADSFDTMTTDRAYRSALSIDYAISELRKNAGTQFCPVAVEAFIRGFQLQMKEMTTRH